MLHQRTVVLLTAVGVLAFGAVGAQAHAPHAVNCTFTGSTTALTPIAPPPATGGSGTFEFAAPAPFHGTVGAAVCADNSGGAPYNVTIASAGSYDNIVCGTGRVPKPLDPRASATITGIPGHSPTTVFYEIVFASGAGAVTVFNTAVGGSLIGAGAVDITPTNLGGCVTTAVTGFDVVGNVTATV